MIMVAGGRERKGKGLGDERRERYFGNYRNIFFKYS
jgi:hypothetical protein